MPWVLLCLLLLHHTTTTTVVDNCRLASSLFMFLRGCLGSRIDRVARLLLCELSHHLREKHFAQKSQYLFHLLVYLLIKSRSTQLSNVTPCGIL